MKKKKSFLYQEDRFYEMFNLVPKHTGLNEVVWILAKTGKEKHGARIKIRDKDKNLIPLSVSANPEWPEGEPNLPRKEIKRIIDWAIINRSLLLKYWLRGENIDLVDFISKIKKID